MTGWDDELASMRPLAGGWSGETFLAEVAGERQVVRIHARRPERAEVDAALLRLVRGLVPVPDVLEVRRPSDGQPALLVTSYVQGVRGDLLLGSLAERHDVDGLARVGTAVGRVAATLAGVPMPHGGDLRVGPGGDLLVRPWDAAEVPGSLPELVGDAVLPGFTTAERRRLTEVAESAERLLSAVERVSLAHGDLNPKNLLLDPDTLGVVALLDWEFAHAGHPFTDLGNLLRLERAPRFAAYAEALLTAFCARRGIEEHAAALDLAHAADLWALVDLAERAGENPVADRAHALLRGIAQAGDAGWTPPPAAT